MLESARGLGSACPQLEETSGVPSNISASQKNSTGKAFLTFLDHSCTSHNFATFGIAAQAFPALIICPRWRPRCPMRRRHAKSHALPTAASLTWLALASLAALTGGFSKADQGLNQNAQKNACHAVRAAFGILGWRSLMGFEALRGPDPGVALDFGRLESTPGAPEKPRHTSHDFCVQRAALSLRCFWGAQESDVAAGGPANSSFPRKMRPKQRCNASHIESFQVAACVN